MREALTVRETAFLLQTSEMAVRRMIAGGWLMLVGERRTADGRRFCQVSPESAQAHFSPAKPQLLRLIMGAILAGRFGVPAPATRWGTPAPLKHRHGDPPCIAPPSAQIPARNS